MNNSYKTPEYKDIKVGNTLYSKDLNFEIPIDSIDTLYWFLHNQNRCINNEGVECVGISLENYLIKE